MRSLLTAMMVMSLLPAAAQAGGFATAGVLNPPSGVEAGETWTAQVEILQHGRTPLEGIAPAVVVGSERFEATPVAGRPGVYEADVVFPRAGEITYRVDDGFTNVEPHVFTAQVAAPGSTTAAGGSDFPWLPIGGAALGALLAAAVVLTLRRRRSAVPA